MVGYMPVPQRQPQTLLRASEALQMKVRASKRTSEHAKKCVARTHTQTRQARKCASKKACMHAHKAHRHAQEHARTGASQLTDQCAVRKRQVSCHLFIQDVSSSVSSYHLGCTKYHVILPIQPAHSKSALPAVTRGTGAPMVMRFVRSFVKSVSSASSGRPMGQCTTCARGVCARECA